MSFTPRDTEILLTAIQCLKDPKALQIDFEKLAEAGGFKNAKSANASFGPIKKKLEAAAGGTPITTATTPRKSKAKAKSQTEIKGDGDGEEDTPADHEATPTSTPVKKRVQKKKDKSTDHNDNEAAPITPTSDEPTVFVDDNDGEHDSATVTPTHKKGTTKPKANTKGNESTPTKAAPKKRGPNVKKEINGDDETTSSPVVKKRATKPKNTGNTDGEAAAIMGTEKASIARNAEPPITPSSAALADDEMTTGPTAKKRGRKPKDDSAPPPAKRTKKTTAAETVKAEENDRNELSDDTITAATESKTSLFGPHVAGHGTTDYVEGNEEEQVGVTVNHNTRNSLYLPAEEEEMIFDQKAADDALFSSYTNLED